MRDTARTFLTPPQVAERYGIDPSKVVAWIRKGELRGINIAANASGRPRFVVSEVDLIAFENRRAATPVKAIPRRKKTERPGVIRFF